MLAVSFFLLLLGDAQFDAIVASATPRTHDQVCARMETWVAANPADPQAPRGLLWMAQLRRADERTDLARPLYQRVAQQYPATEWALHARKGLADLDAQQHRYSRAIETYEALAREPSAFWKYVGSSAARAARGERTRFWIFVALALSAIALWTLRLSRAGLRALWPPPGEVLYPLPALLLVLLAAAGQEPDEARAICAVAIGALILLWLNGAWLRARPRRRGLDAALAVAQLAALLYCCIVATGLWGKLLDTFAGGGD